jgi:hypothetical protein
MKTQIFSLLLSIFLLGFIPRGALGQGRQQQRSLAVTGDTVWVIVNPVKADKRADFERFVHEIFWPGASKLSKEEQKLFRQTRILHPVKPEADGTYSYFFIMDPLNPRGNYNIEHFLTEMYGEIKAKEHMKLYTDAMAGEQKQYKVVQSAH